ncbi:translation initiation factor IF-2-like [Girardinichthys multiradiatus]|uniref:translation initiation factor IF-2-like n=1 Tax=Girardinichthys multiradiatus TaxID=208333 RepID=UPI001FAB7983|nr:translation initiation factor IF-2-like [Girardinichthys multiradiatus]
MVFGPFVAVGGYQTPTRVQNQPKQGGRWGPQQEGQKQKQSSGWRPGGRPQQAQSSGRRPGGCPQQAQSSGRRPGGRPQQAQSSGGRTHLHHRVPGGRQRSRGGLRREPAGTNKGPSRPHKTLRNQPSDTDADANKANYVALNFPTKKTKGMKKKTESPPDCVYSAVRAGHPTLHEMS